MSNTATLELRIHAGIHAGAHAPLPEQDACTIGADPACDFVLADEGIAPSHLRLTRDGAGAWKRESSGESSGETDAQEAVVPGRLLSLGPVVVSFDEADSPWPDAQAVEAAAQHAAAAPAAPADEAAMTEASPSPEDDAPAAMPEPPPPAQATADAPGPRLSAAARIAGVLLLCLAALLGAALWWLSTLQDASAAPLPAAAPANAAVQRAAIENVLRSLRLEDRATLSATPLGGWAVEAAALDEETLEALALALSRLDPRPGLRVAATEETIEARARRLLADLQAQRLGTVRGEWSGDRARLEIVASVAANDVARWERALIQTAQRHPDVPFHARLERLPAKPPARLPFRVMTVVNGATDYVVLDDGSKLLLAGRRDGWQLVAVDAHEAVFENGRALRVSVPR
ncbi:MAG: hypothetical protein H3C26_00400 [Rhodocyclaceae bacterium]|nr:hypothetical protein [Rhodocyclaceae bacterium]